MRFSCVKDFQRCGDLVPTFIEQENPSKYLLLIRITMAMIRMNFEREGGRLVFYSILFIQFFTLGYHQITTRIDLFPFNGARHYSVRERSEERRVGKEYSSRCRL